MMQVVLTKTRRGMLFLSLLMVGNLTNTVLLLGQNYTLSNWLVEDGLSSNEVTDILQDEDGFIWVATKHGLNKFDGYAFKQFRYHPNDSTSMGANYMSKISQDTKGNIWMILGVGVLSKYDKVTQQFTNYYFKNPTIHIRDFAFIPNWGICLVTDQELYTIDQATNNLQPLTFENEHTFKKINQLFTASQQRIYLTTHQGFHLLSLQDTSLAATYLINAGDTLLFKDPIDKLYEDSKGDLWAQTKKGDLYHAKDGINFKKSLSINHSSTSFPLGKLFINEADQGKKWLMGNDQRLYNYQDSTNSWELERSSKQAIQFAFQDHAANIWICTKTNELLKWNGTAWIKMLHLGDQLNAWEISKVFVDNKNGIWLGTYGKGIWHAHYRKWPISELKSKPLSPSIDFNISALALDDRGFMWMSNFQQLYRYYFKTNTLEVVYAPTKKDNPLTKLQINQIVQNKKGDLFIATSEGLVLMDKEAKKARHYKSFWHQNKQFPLKFIRCALPDEQSGKVWLGGPQGLFLFDLHTENANYYAPSEKNGRFLHGGDVQCFLKISENSFLIGFTKYGAALVTINRTDFSIVSKALSYANPLLAQSNFMTVNTIYQADSTYWAGTYSKGLLQLDLDKLTLTPISADFPIIPNIKGILQGAKGNLWVSSIDGLRSVKPIAQTYYRFSKASGLLSNHFNKNAAIRTREGHLFFGNKNGVNKIEPSKWIRQDTLATPILTAFKKFDTPVIFDKSINELAHINLTYQDDFISFDFVSPTFDSPNDVQYVYQLKGFDDTWRYGDNQRFVTYTNLAPGNYTFNLRAVNKGGFSNSSTKSIKLFVSPPFWQTNWFVFLVIILLIIIYWIIYHLQWQIRKQRLQAIAAIRRKTAEDFHDELGHRLTKIGLFVESLMLQRESFPETAVRLLRKIQDNTNELYHTTRDFIWAMNPSKDAANELLVICIF